MSIYDNFCVILHKSMLDLKTGMPKKMPKLKQNMGADNFPRLYHLPSRSGDQVHIFCWLNHCCLLKT